ncbi:MAG: hypothetical protein BWY31_04533 [Lentisphaerae bacterium ADurb.Bin242]|nr:MAG: hypothetical protein BWY31_04533 [Lentisphaerae bacterium ADurb.Bin242]
METKFDSILGNLREADSAAIPEISIPPIISICNGRLTLESGSPVSFTDQTAKTDLYFTPCNGNQIAIHDGEEWKLRSFSELHKSLTGTTANTNYDVFVWDNSGTLELELVPWANNTTRSTAIALQDGIYVKSGALKYRYLGTIRTSSTAGQSEDSTSHRFIWNYYNQITLEASISQSITYGYTVAAWRESYGGSGMTRAEIVTGMPSILTPILGMYAGGSGYLYLSLDSPANTWCGKLWSNGYVCCDVQLSTAVGIGYHYITYSEYSGGSMTVYAGFSSKVTYKG